MNYSMFMLKNVMTNYLYKFSQTSANDDDEIVIYRFDCIV
jgi:hypothetical protein